LFVLRFAVGMPDLDGYEATKLIRKLDDPLKATMNDHISKPYEAAALGQKIVKWLRFQQNVNANGSKPAVSTDTGTLVAAGIPDS
jgi:hypothetical protein